MRPHWLHRYFFFPRMTEDVGYGRTPNPSGRSYAEGFLRLLLVATQRYDCRKVSLTPRMVEHLASHVHPCRSKLHKASRPSRTRFPAR